MATQPLIRPLDTEDEANLKAIDDAYAAQHSVTPVINRASVSFYARSGHAFVVVWAGEIVGFVLAQAVWYGSHPVVTVSRIAVRDDAPVSARPALIEALTKSAYDAAVYDVTVLQPAGDSATRAALEDKSYQQRNMILYERILGSRGQLPTKES